MRITNSVGNLSCDPIEQRTESREVTFYRAPTQHQKIADRALIRRGDVIDNSYNINYVLVTELGQYNAGSTKHLYILYGK